MPKKQPFRSAEATESSDKRGKMEKGIRPTGPQKWEVMVFTGRDPEPKRVRHVSRTVHGGIKAARRVRTELLTEVSQGKHGSSKGSFGALLED
ncbi:MAG: hypothetical protein ACLQPH_16525 [Acidimicrobiales bacterium]